MTDWKFELGDEVRHTLTPFTGVVVARTEYMTGCHHYGMQAKALKDGRIPDYEWVDGQFLALVKRSKAATSKPAGGPGQNPPTIR